MIKTFIDLWWLWLLIGVFYPPMLLVGLAALALVILSLFDTSELTWEGIKGRPLSDKEKKRRSEGQKELLAKIKKYVKGIFRI